LYTPTRASSLARARAGLAAGLEEEAQEELAHLLGLLPELHGSFNDRRTLAAIEVAIDAVQHDPPNLHLARTIREKIERRVYDRQRLFFQVFRSSAVARVTIGLGLGLVALSLVVGVLAVGLYHLFAPCDLLCADPKGLPDEPSLQLYLPILVILAGAGGGIISIMTRIDRFTLASQHDPWMLFCTGLFKPVIGMGFAFLSFMLLNSGVLAPTLLPTGDQQAYIALALAFIAGFSERFAEDMTHKTGLLVPTPGTH
jgi:hypothetical protein